MSSRKTILVHGGAWATPSVEKEPHCVGVRQAARAGWEVLTRGGSAVDAVCESVRFMEDDPTFNAGRGAVLNRDGGVELDAAVMDGTDLNAGAVAAVQGVRNPVDLARLVMQRSPHILLVGPGATAFGRSMGMTSCSPRELIVKRERERWRQELERRTEKTETLSAEGIGAPPADTVGAVARDENGHLAAATSTGGTLCKLPGRVGDSPVVGAGLYADDRMGAASATGWGEGLVRVVMARRAIDFLGAGNPPAETARRAIGLLEKRTQGRGGIIVLSPDGSLGFAFNTPNMPHAYWTDGMTEPTIGL